MDQDVEIPLEGPSCFCGLVPPPPEQDHPSYEFAHLMGSNHDEVLNLVGTRRMSDETLSVLNVVVYLSSAS